LVWQCRRPVDADWGDSPQLWLQSQAISFVKQILIPMCIYNATIIRQLQHRALQERHIMKIRLKMTFYKHYKKTVYSLVAHLASLWKERRAAVSCVNMYPCPAHSGQRINIKVAVEQQQQKHFSSLQHCCDHLCFYKARNFPSTFLFWKWHIFLAFRARLSIIPSSLARV